MRVGYLVSRYPTVSHTFVRREIASLRRRGLQIDTFSVRKPRAAELRSQLDRDEAARTYNILPTSPLRLVGDCLVAFARHPARWLRALALSLRLRMPGLRGLVWSFFHFGEGIALAVVLERRGIVHLHNHFSNSGATVGLLAARFAGIGWSVTLHGSADFQSQSTATLPLKAALADLIVCVSEYGRRLLLEAGGDGLAAKTMVVRCGIDLKAFPFRGKQPIGNPPQILSVGRLAPEKAQLGLVEAFSLLSEKYVGAARLTIIGEGCERPRLEHAIEERGLVDRVVLSGSATETEVLVALRQADVFALSSRVEGLPVVLMEAMAVGIPVVAPRIAGIPELVAEGVTGRLFDSGNWAQLAGAMFELLDNEAERGTFVCSGRRRVEAEFSSDASVGPLFDWFCRAYGSAAGRQPRSSSVITG